MKTQLCRVVSKDRERAKRLFGKVFDWRVTALGDEHTAFYNAVLMRAFIKLDQVVSTSQGGVVSFCSDDLAPTMKKRACLLGLSFHFLAVDTFILLMLSVTNIGFGQNH